MMKGVDGGAAGGVGDRVGESDDDCESGGPSSDAAIFSFSPPTTNLQ